MLQQLKKRNSGFTIIEVLIVLAIAGLIMVVVFLAVPNLQRNARNNQTKTEANNLLAAYQEVSDNAGGSVLVSTDNTAVTTAANLKTITAANVSITSTIPATVATPSAAPTTYAYFYTGAKCTAQNSNVPVAGTARQAALFYWIETPGSTQVQCINT